MRSTIARACCWKSVLRCGSSGAARFSSRRLGRSPSEGDAYAQAPDSEKDWIGGYSCSLASSRAEYMWRSTSLRCGVWNQKSLPPSTRSFSALVPLQHCKPCKIRAVEVNKSGGLEDDAGLQRSRIVQVAPRACDQSRQRLTVERLLSDAVAVVTGLMDGSTFGF